MRRERLARIGLLLACAALVAWVRILPLSLAGLEPRVDNTARAEVEQRLAAAQASTWIAAHSGEYADVKSAVRRKLQDEYRYDDGHGRQYVYLGDIDSYLWLRQARTFLRTGTTCGEIVDGVCRDSLTHAPVGRADEYAGSPHSLAIAGLHWLITRFDAFHPLPASAFLVPVVVGVLGTLPAFFLGLRLGGELGAVVAALLIGTNTYFILRSAGADNDVWNVVLPLFALWATCGALAARHWGKRVALSLAAGAVIGVQAATWRGWPFIVAMLLAGVAVATLMQAARALFTRSRVGARLVPMIAVAVMLYIASGIAIRTLAPEEPYWSLPFSVFASVRAQGAPLPKDDTHLWPDTFAAVGELVRPDRDHLIEATGGPYVLALAWVGVVALALPARWRWWHLVVIAAAAIVAPSLVYSNIPRSTMLALVAVQSAVSVILLAPRSDDSAADDTLSLIVIFWFLAALYLGSATVRLLLLIAVPLGLAAAALLGRLHRFLVGLVEPYLQRWPRVAPSIRVGLFAVLAAVLVAPVASGVATARNMLPRINDAWWNSFAALSRTAPADAILHTWWDRGYWAAYAGERRVSNDGASLSTHIPYWTGAALMAPSERQSMGILRMLDCGSEATPRPEGARGAYGKLLSYGIDSLHAPALISALAERDREHAAQLLRARGLDEKQIADVLASTHCDPPPAYLVLGTEMIEQAAWRRMGSWDFERAFVAGVSRNLPREEAIRETIAAVGGDAETAAAMVEEASALRPGEDVNAYISPPSVYITPDWFACEWAEAERELRCPIPANPRRLSRFVYRSDTPGDSTLYTQLQPGRETEGTPAVVVFDGDDERQVYEFDSPDHPTIGVLVDLKERRALLASPNLARSTFSQLFYVGGRTSKFFAQIGERSTLAGDRVITWEIRWPGWDRGL